MRASKAIYHPNGDATIFATVEETLDDQGAGIATLESDLATLETDLTAVTDALDTRLDAAEAALNTVTDTFSLFIATPVNQDYVVWLNIPFALTFASMTTKATAGTCTLAAKINTTAITGLSNSVSTTEVENTATAANVVVAGDDLRLTVTSTSSCVNMSVTLKFTRDLL